MFCKYSEMKFERRSLGIASWMLPNPLENLTLNVEKPSGQLSMILQLQLTAQATTSQHLTALLAVSVSKSISKSVLVHAGLTKFYDKFLQPYTFMPSPFSFYQNFHNIHLLFKD